MRIESERDKWIFRCVECIVVVVDGSTRAPRTTHDISYVFPVVRRYHSTTPVQCHNVTLFPFVRAAHGIWRANDIDVRRAIYLYSSIFGDFTSCCEYQTRVR